MSRSMITTPRKIDERTTAMVCLVTVCPVSYTHLDVYKRQVVDTAQKQVIFTVLVSQHLAHSFFNRLYNYDLAVI